MPNDGIDDILSKLGIEDDLDDSQRQLGPADRLAPADPPGPAPVEPPPPGRGLHTIDTEEAAFSPLPAVPGHQGGRSKAIEDPAVRRQPRQAAKSSVGDAFSDIYSPEGASDAPELAKMLVESGAITSEQLSNANNVIKASPGRSLAQLVIEQGADEEAVLRVVAESAGAKFERLDFESEDGAFDGTMLQRLGIDFAKSSMVIPIRREGPRVVVGATRASDVHLVDEVKRKLNVPSVKLVVVTSADIKKALDTLGESDAPEVDVNELLEGVEEQDVEVDQTSSNEPVDLEAAAGESPVIRYVNYIIHTAVREGASDIHIEPQEKKVKVRFRIDGVLFEMMNPPASMGAAITSRLKIMADLDISERRVPQDGRIRCTVQGRKLDLRVSTLPTPTGEKTVMRILDTKSINVKLEQLGFEDETFEIWNNQVQSPHGIILVTGPTGSGKTTTLYSSLRVLDKVKLNISTVEDPVEYHLDGITQTQTHEKIGMTFAAALRALLRQDPDVIMVGEIRDLETALTAVQAALTGHLVLSTLHTNDAPSSVTRLVNIGLEPFLVGAAINAVLAQRLVRRLCTNCKAQETPSEELAEYLEMNGFPSSEQWVAKGCDKCRQTGYQGRVGIYELLSVDDQVRDVIARNPNVSEFRRLCLERGMVSLQADGLKKVARGLTTVQEILRVTREGH
ncbi:MAG: GspE/PulE family protein [Planctomycetota bacterium]